MDGLQDGYHTCLYMCIPEQYYNVSIQQYCNKFIVPLFPSGKFQYTIWAGGHWSLMSVFTLIFIKQSDNRYQYVRLLLAIQGRNIMLDQTVDVHTYVNSRYVTLVVPIFTASSNKYCCHKYNYQY